MEQDVTHRLHVWFTGYNDDDSQVYGLLAEGDESFIWELETGVVWRVD